LFPTDFRRLPGDNRVLQTTRCFSKPSAERDTIMIKWALIFAVISLIAGIFGFTGIAADSAAVAKVLFFIALTIFAIFLFIAIFIGEKLSS
jgi:uncharacterized membrane protein YtjA (UPF0391 family)